MMEPKYIGKQPFELPDGSFLHYGDSLDVLETEPDILADLTSRDLVELPEAEPVKKPRKSK